jgi:hypothetical protein
MDTLSALARLLTIAPALGERVAGFLARLRIMTAVAAGRMFGLISAGGVGVALICCVMVSVGSSPSKGNVPVSISYRITPRE